MEAILADYDLIEKLISRIRKARYFILRFFIPFLIGATDIKLPQVGVGVLYGLLIGIVVFKLFFYGLKELTAATATTLMYLEVVSAIVLGYFILGEKLSWNILAGGATILISSFYISKLNRKHVLTSST